MEDRIRAFARGEKIEIEQFFQGLTPRIQRHSEAVAQLTRGLVEWAEHEQPDELLELPESALLERAVRYHDIGFAIIPQRVIEKRTELTDAEFRVIQRHALYGGSILENVKRQDSTDEKEWPLWELAAELAANHHERWDGKGYPFGQLTTAVPMLARAVAVADAFDSIVRGAEHRMPLPPEYALLEIVQNSGTQFDPFWVEIFRDYFESEEEDICCTSIAEA